MAEAKELLTYNEDPDPMPQPKPSSYMQWVPSDSMDRIVRDGREKFRYYTEWLDWLCKLLGSPGIDVDGHRWRVRIAERHHPKSDPGHAGPQQGHAHNLRGKPMTKQTLRKAFETARAEAALAHPELAEQIRAMCLYDLWAKTADDVSDDRQSDQAAANLLRHNKISTAQALPAQGQVCPTDQVTRLSSRPPRTKRLRSAPQAQ